MKDSNIVVCENCSKTFIFEEFEGHECITYYIWGTKDGIHWNRISPNRNTQNSTPRDDTLEDDRTILFITIN
jgi:hypothetical protein